MLTCRFVASASQDDDAVAAATFPASALPQSEARSGSPVRK
jgi:hypothetical protein